MESNKQKRKKIKESRLKKAKKRQELIEEDKFEFVSKDVVLANHAELQHNNTYSSLPDYYVDVPYICQDCGSEEIWTAKQQKWWYEIIKGNINSCAIRCFACRKKIRDEKDKQKQHMVEMAAKDLHPNEAFFRYKYR